MPFCEELRGNKGAGNMKMNLPLEIVDIIVSYAYSPKRVIENMGKGEKHFLWPANGRRDIHFRRISPTDVTCYDYDVDRLQNMVSRSIEEIKGFLEGGLNSSEMGREPDGVEKVHTNVELIVQGNSERQREEDW